MVFGAVETITGVVSAAIIAVISIAAQRRISREQYETTKKEWQDIFERQSAHVEVLEHRISDLQEQVTASKETVSRVQRQSERWSERNAALYEVIQSYRVQLAQLGHDPGPEPNGVP
jgi:TolA-binding protein